MGELVQVLGGELECGVALSRQLQPHRSNLQPPLQLSRGELEKLMHLKTASEMHVASLIFSVGTRDGTRGGTWDGTGGGTWDGIFVL